MGMSVVIPTYNREKALEAVLTNIRDQTISPNEVIIVNNGEETKRVKELSKGSLYIKTQENSLTLAKELGTHKAKGEIVIFLDDDMRIPEDYVENIEKFFQKNPEAIGVMGKNMSNPKMLEKRSYWFKRVFYIVTREGFIVMPSLGIGYGNKEKKSRTQWLSGAAAWRKKEVMKIGFDKRLKKYANNEDIDLSFRAFRVYPKGLYFCPEIRYWHEKTELRRTPTKELIYMGSAYDYYLHYKLWNKKKDRAIFYWSRIGRLAINLIVSRIDLRYVGAEFHALRNLCWLKQGDLKYFTRILEEENATKNN